MMRSIAASPTPSSSTAMKFNGPHHQHAFVRQQRGQWGLLQVLMLRSDPANPHL